MKWSILFSAALAGWLSGCAQTPPPAPTVEQQATVDADFNAVWDAATEVLRQYRFTIDRADRRAGVIATGQMTGRYLFEFWRDDAATPTDVLEGTLQTIYRQATVTITRAEGIAATQPMGGYIIDVAVNVSRSDKPEPQATSVGDVYDLYVNPERVYRETGTAMDENSRSAQGVTVSLGRDENLQKILTRKITSLALTNMDRYLRPAPPAREVMPGDRE